MKITRGAARRAAIATVALAAGLSLVAAACDSAVKAAPVPGRVVLAGDSLTVQARMYGTTPADDAWDDSDNMIGLGWQAENSQPGVTRAVADPARSPSVLVSALGENDVATSWGRDGFTQEDRNQLLALFLSPADGTCTVIVLPHYAGTDASQRAGVEAFRSWVMNDVVPLWPERFSVVDWRPTAVDHPEFLDPDGMHLNVNDPAHAADAADAYIDLMDRGVEACNAR